MPSYTVSYRHKESSESTKLMNQKEVQNNFLLNTCLQIFYYVLLVQEFKVTMFIDSSLLVPGSVTSAHCAFALGTAIIIDNII